MEPIEKVPVKSFSIFNPSIRFDHREFYERIIGELNGIFPVCNQGESMAVNISDNTTEQEQITELMKRMEKFARELLDITKRLFDQYYVAKEALHHSILTTTSFNKINTLDRNLLERTCDVRWWALETAFSDCIASYETAKANAHELCAALQVALDGISAQPGEPAKASPELIGLIKQLQKFDSLLKYQYLQKVSDWMERMEDKIFSSIASPHTKELYTGFIQNCHLLNKHVEHSCRRLEDIRNSYTLYRDLVIATKTGVILANSNADRRAQVLGISVANESWFIQAIATKNGSEYYAQDVTDSQVEEQQSLVYTTAVREKGDENGPVLGAMGVYFDLQGEASLILDEYMPKDINNITIDGTYSMFTNAENRIIASNDGSILEVGKSAHIPRRNRSLAAGEKVGSYLVFEGVDSAIFSARTSGYLDYRGLGWSSHVIIPKDLIFDSSVSMQRPDIHAEDLMKSKIIPEINKQTYIKVQDDKESIQLISLNGIVFASKLGKRGASLGPIFNQITKSGDFVTSRMEDLLKEMAMGELNLNLLALENYSKQAIDLIDRNLFERAADVRWWATDQYLWQALMEPTEHNLQKASDRLKIINSSYPMYRNIILADSAGTIQACSRLELKNELAKINVSDHFWFQNGIRTAHSSDFAVQDVVHSSLEKSKDLSLAYSGGIREKGAREGSSIGVLGILFDWDTEAKKILSVCLPIGNDGAPIEGSVAFYTNNQHEVIETTDPKIAPIGMKVGFDKSTQALKAGESSSGIFVLNGTKYLLGSSRTKGYREYAGLGWMAHTLRPLE